MAKSTQRADKQKGPSAKTKKRNRSGRLIWLVIGAALVVVVGVIVLQGRLLRSGPSANPTVSEGTAWGSPDAPVQIVAYSDFGCTHCRAFAQNQGKQLRAEYETSGNLRFEFRSFIVGGQTSADAANAALCAADQNRFWDYHDLLFSQQGVSANPFAKATLKRYADQLGLDSTAFSRCVDSNQHRAQVEKTSGEARDQGINSTPTFLINGEKLIGAVPYQQFKDAVDRALASAQS